jgi:micrococcal nuclease
LLIVLAAFLLGFVTAQVVSAVRKPAERPASRSLALSIADGGVYGVRAVVDGDTLILENGLHVRYLGINAPETGRFVKDAAPLADEATARNIALVEGKRVRLVLGPNPFDLHGRIIARVLLPNENGVDTDVCAALVTEGLARANGQDLPKEEYQRLKGLEEEARQTRRGLWGVTERPAEERPYCAASKTAVYHRSTCAHVPRIAPANRHYYAAVEEAEAAGLKPCGQCLATKQR